MNWDAFAAISEFGGALAVVVSLLYLAAQVRNHTRAVVMRQNEFRQYRLGLLSEDVWKQSDDVIVMLLAFPWGRNWWNVLGREQVRPEFAAHIDHLLENVEMLDLEGALVALKTLATLEDADAGRETEELG